MEYTVIQADSLSDLIKYVNYAIAEGFKPIGGVMITPSSMYAAPTYAQAMTKE